MRDIKKRFPDVFLITDVCFCEFTSHGHCGIIKNNSLDNDTTIEYLQKQVISHARAGADMVAPSAMIDGSVKYIRKDNNLKKKSYIKVNKNNSPFAVLEKLTIN